MPSKTDRLSVAPSASVTVVQYLWSALKVPQSTNCPLICTSPQLAPSTADIGSVAGRPLDEVAHESWLTNSASTTSVPLRLVQVPDTQASYWPGSVTASVVVPVML